MELLVCICGIQKCFVLSAISYLDWHTSCRSTKFCSMWNLIRKKTSLILCPSYSAGKFVSAYVLMYVFANFKRTVILIILHSFYLLSDWNGSKRGHVYKFLRSQGFVSSYDTAHQYKDADAQKVPVPVA